MDVAPGPKLTRRAAVKLGALGVAGAVFAGVLPRRAGATSSCTSGQGCSGNVTCGTGCRCQTIYYGRLKPANGPFYACAADVACGAYGYCPQGQFQCRPGTVCVADTCCANFGNPPVCVPVCSQSRLAPVSPGSKTWTTRGKV